MIFFKIMRGERNEHGKDFAMLPYYFHQLFLVDFLGSLRKVDKKRRCLWG